MSLSLEIAALIEAGDKLLDDLSVLLSEDHIEGIVDTIGLSLNEHMAEWERVSGEIDPRL